MEKNYCAIHHLYHNGSICPFCQSEKLNKLHFKYKPSYKKINEGKKEVSLTDIEKLKQHFCK